MEEIRHIITGHMQLPQKAEADVLAVYGMIAEAESRLATMDPASDQYQAIVSAAVYLQNLIDSGAASQEELTNAMTTLTRAMAGLY